MKSYLTFEEDIFLHRKTKVVLVRSGSSKGLLGVIKWYGAWRQYCFYPASDTLWSTGCLQDVNSRIEEMMLDWRISKKSEMGVGNEV